MTVFISGKISGVKNWQKNFEKAENKAREALTQYEFVNIVSPIKISRMVDATKINPFYEDYVYACIQQLINCDAVFFQWNWIFSKGARLEHHVARVLGKLIIYE